MAKSTKSKSTKSEFVIADLTADDCIGSKIGEKSQCLFCLKYFSTKRMGRHFTECGSIHEEGKVEFIKNYNKSHKRPPVSLFCLLFD